MKCELNRMRSDVVKSITFGTLINIIIGFVIAVGIAWLCFAAIVTVIELFFEYPQNRSAMHVVLYLMIMLAPIPPGYQLYSWYTRSYKWCNSRGDKDA